jgi:SAM-dependent methyltransferase
MEQQDHWKAYYQKLGKRQPRELFQKLMGFIEQAGLYPIPGVAVDLGCGDGTETLALLGAGWSVIAIDESADAIERVKIGASLGGWDRVQVQQASFDQAMLPPADLIYAGLSLPFCPPDVFPQLWQKIRQALHPGGCFAGHFFGVRDGWADNPEWTFHTGEQVQSLLDGLQIQYFQEAEDDRPSVFEAMKHFHYFEVIARRPVE